MERASILPIGNGALFESFQRSTRAPFYSGGASLLDRTRGGRVRAAADWIGSRHAATRAGTRIGAASDARVCGHTWRALDGWRPLWLDRAGGAAAGRSDFVQRADGTLFSLAFSFSFACGWTLCMLCCGFTQTCNLREHALYTPISLRSLYSPYCAYQ